MPFLVEEYVRENGAVPYQDWFDSLDAAAAAKVAVAKVRLTLLCHLRSGGFRWKLAMRCNSLRLLTT